MGQEIWRHVWTVPGATVRPREDRFGVGILARLLTGRQSATWSAFHCQGERRILSCGLRRSKLSSANRICSFIATEAVEGIIGQIAEPQETMFELNVRHHLAFG
jgi:hypothetical protein